MVDRPRASDIDWARVLAGERCRLPPGRRSIWWTRRSVPLGVDHRHTALVDVAVPLALVGVLLIALRRPISRLLLEWRQLFPPKLRNPETRAGEVVMTLLGCFALLLSLIAVVGS